MTHEQTTDHTAEKPYTTPSLRDEGDVTTRTLGWNPITPKESVDLMGYDPAVS